MKLPAYRKYKRSGVEWFSEVPEHWTPKRLKTAARCWVSNVDKVPSDDELPVRLCNYTDVYYNERITPKMPLMETTATAEEIGKFHLEVDDVVITKDSEEWSDIAVPALVAETADDLLCGYHLGITRPKQETLRGDYLLRAFQACAVNQQFQVAATGVTRYGLPKAAIGDAWLPFPPVDEQREIADFLDRETARLDTLVGKKRKLIEKLQEKRTALISSTVTCGLPSGAASAAGLNPHPKFKPSGVEWLGDIPSHWKLNRLRHLLKGRLTNGLFKTQEFFGSGTRLINVYDAYRHDFFVDEKSLERVETTPTELKNYAVQSDDIFFVRSSLKVEGVGRAVCCSSPTEDIVFECHLVRARPQSSIIDSAFLIAFLNSSFGIHNLISKANTVTMATLSQMRILDIVVAVPSRDEQSAIVDYLDRETAKLDRMMEKVEAAIEKLQEYRTALITAAVTGKIDVRKVAA
jgi:type I restriction enzyme S subunit